jgi:hypothetical protein
MLACEHSVAVEGLVQTLLYHIVDNVMHRGSMDAVENGIGRGPLYIARRALVHSAARYVHTAPRLCCG